MSAPVVTGLGIMAPTGTGVEDYWKATLAGHSGIGRVERFDVSWYPSRLAGEIRDLQPEELLPDRLRPQTDRMTRFALVGAQWAVEDAGMDLAGLPEFAMGVVTASHAGGFEFGQDELRALWGQGSEYVSAYQSFAWFYAVNSGQISIRHGLRGPSSVVVSDQAGGLDALAHARREIGRGSSAMLCGAADGSLCPWGWVAQLAGGGMSQCDDPARAYLPFDLDASGYVPGEGGALLMLESSDSAASRGAPHRYAEIAGQASTFDADRSSPDALAAAVSRALADAGACPSDVDVVFADAAGTPELDRAEERALVTVFGERGVPVTAPKTMTGRLYSGAAPLDVATACLAIRDGVIPPTVHTTGSGCPGLDLVLGQPREARLRTVLIVARGHRGFCSALVLRAVPGHHLT